MLTSSPSTVSLFPMSPITVRLGRVCPCNALMDKTLQPDVGPFTSMKPSLNQPMIDLIKTLENTIGAPPITGLFGDVCVSGTAEIRATDPGDQSLRFGGQWAAPN